MHISGYKSQEKVHPTRNTHFEVVNAFPDFTIEEGHYADLPTITFSFRLLFDSEACPQDVPLDGTFELLPAQLEHWASKTFVIMHLESEP